MSYITNLETVYKNIKALGTFNFTTEVYQDAKMINIAKTAYPLMLIDNDPLITNGQILEGLNGLETPLLRMYFLTKFDASDNLLEHGETIRNLESKAIEPMKSLAVTVFARYLREYELEVFKEVGVPTTYRLTNLYNIWGANLSGVLLETQNFNVKRSINYCTIT